MGQLLGPLDSADLRRMAKSGEITPGDKIRDGEDGKWVEAGKVKGLFDTIAPRANVAAEPPTVPARASRPRPPVPPAVVMAEP